MAYEKNLRIAARRHYADGCKLFDDHRYDNAGYHFGFAAECAVKERLLECGVLDGDESIWKHWPKLRALGLAAIKSRSGADVRRMLIHSAYMASWDVTMRYGVNAAVSAERAQQWKDDANIALGLLI